MKAKKSRLPRWEVDEKGFDASMTAAELRITHVKGTRDVLHVLDAKTAPTAAERKALAVIAKKTVAGIYKRERNKTKRALLLYRVINCFRNEVLGEALDIFTQR